MQMRRISLYAGVLLLVSFGSAQQTQSPAKPQPVLDLTSMDQTIDPCADFYTYSCGGWMKKNPIPPDQSSWSAYGKLQDENTAQLRGILETASAPDPARNAANQKIGDYYAACMDEKAVEALGIKPIQPYLQEIEQLNSKAALAAISAERAPYHNLVFRFRSEQDAKDSTQMIARTDQGGLGMPDRDYYLKDDAKSQELRKAY